MYLLLSYLLISVYYLRILLFVTIYLFNYCLLLLCINGYLLSITFLFYLCINSTYLFSNIIL